MKKVFFYLAVFVVYYSKLQAQSIITINPEEVAQVIKVYYSKQTRSGYEQKKATQTYKPNGTITYSDSIFITANASCQTDSVYYFVKDANTQKFVLTQQEIWNYSNANCIDKTIINLDTNYYVINTTKLQVFFNASNNADSVLLFDNNLITSKIINKYITVGNPMPDSIFNYVIDSVGTLWQNAITFYSFINLQPVQMQLYTKAAAMQATFVNTAQTTYNYIGASTHINLYSYNTITNTWLPIKTIIENKVNNTKHAITKVWQANLAQYVVMDSTCYYYNTNSVIYDSMVKYTANNNVSNTIQNIFGNTGELVHTFKYKMATNNVMYMYNSSNTYYEQCKPNGIVALSNTYSVNMYPNPATAAQQISIQDKVAKVIITNLQGKIISTISNQNFFTAPATTGIYIIQVVLQNGNIVTQKLSVQ